MKGRLPVMLLFAAALVLLLSGCIEMSTRVKVEKDGSGKVEQTFLMKTEIVEMLKNLGQSDEPFELYTEEEVENQAEGMGPGVSLISVEPIEKRALTGYFAVYGFEDINDLRVNQNPDAQVPEQEGEGDSVREYYTFDFTEGRTALLRINAPNEESTETSDGTPLGEEQPQEEYDPEMAEMMRQIYRDMRISMAVEVGGSIEKTNAEFVEGSTVTLMDLDFNRLLEKEGRFEELMRNQTDTLEETKTLLRGIPGLSIELADPVEVRFR